MQEGAKLDVFTFEISNSKTFKFLKLVEANLLIIIGRERPTEKTKLSIVNYIKI